MAKKPKTDGENPIPEINGSGSGTINGDGENLVILNGDGDGRPIPDPIIRLYTRLHP